MKLAAMATLTVTVRLSDVSVIRQKPTADPVSTPATVVQENVVDALDALVAVQPAIPLMLETDHEYVYGPVPPETMLAVVDPVVMFWDTELVALTELGDVCPRSGGDDGPTEAEIAAKIAPLIRSDLRP